MERCIQGGPLSCTSHGHTIDFRNHRLPQQINMNHYATKKTIATGLLVVSLLMANAALLKSVLQQGKYYEFYGFLISMLVLAILAEITAGVLLLLIGRDDLNNIYKQKKLDWLNNIATACVFGITAINIFIAAFGLKNIPLGEVET
ncbi:ninjurin-2-like [Glandiceps talaboti]